MQLFTAATQHLTPAVVMYKYLEKKVIPSEALKTAKLHQNCKLGFDIKVYFSVTTYLYVKYIACNSL
jgi:hypothetical protein